MKLPNVQKYSELLCLWRGFWNIPCMAINMLWEVSKTNHTLVSKSDSLLGVLVVLIKQFIKDGFRWKLNENFYRVEDRKKPREGKP